MTNNRFQRAARINKAKAVFLTVALHIVLIAGFASYGDGSVKDMIPEKVKTFLGMDQDTNSAKDNNDEVALRP